jgi:hypothetical protein
MARFLILTIHETMQQQCGTYSTCTLQTSRLIDDRYLLDRRYPTPTEISLITLDVLTGAA